MSPADAGYVVSCKGVLVDCSHVITRYDGVAEGCFGHEVLLGISKEAIHHFHSQSPRANTESFRHHAPYLNMALWQVSLASPRSMIVTWPEEFQQAFSMHMNSSIPASTGTSLSYSAANMPRRSWSEGKSS